MTNFVMTFNSMSELRDELNRLETLSEIKEQQIDTKFKEIKKKASPVIKVFNIITGRKSLNDYGFLAGAAFIKGLKIAIPYLLPTHQGGFIGALTAVGGELLLKNIKNIDFSKITSEIMGLFNKKPKEDYRKTKYYTSED